MSSRCGTQKDGSRALASFVRSNYIHRMNTTRAAGEQPILLAAIEAFGQRGLEGASTRDIAKAANKPMSAITYHFGGKEGLYKACAEQIARSMGGQMASALAAAEEIFTEKQDGAAARNALSVIFERYAAAMVSDEIAVFARFIVREQMDPTEAFDILWGGVMGRLLDRIASLLVTISGQRLSIAEARVRTMALMGQVIVFRVAHATVLRLNRWKQVGPAQRRAIHQVIQAHLSAILDQLATGATR